MTTALPLLVVRRQMLIPRVPSVDSERLRPQHPGSSRRAVRACRCGADRWPQHRVHQAPHSLPTISPRPLIEPSLQVLQAKIEFAVVAPCSQPGLKHAQVILCHLEPHRRVHQDIFGRFPTWNRDLPLQPPSRSTVIAQHAPTESLCEYSARDLAQTDSTRRCHLRYAVEVSNGESLNRDIAALDSSVCVLARFLSSVQA